MCVFKIRVCELSQKCSWPDSLNSENIILFCSTVLSIKKYGPQLMEHQSLTLKHFPLKQDINISSNIAVQTNVNNKMLHVSKHTWCNLSLKHLFSLNAKRNTGL